MKEQLFLTVTHINSYAGCGLFRPGMRLKLRKDHDNPYDDEAIAVYGKHDANTAMRQTAPTQSAGGHIRPAIFSMYSMKKQNALCVLSPKTLQ